MKSEHPQKLACRFELRGTIADYCATAAGTSRPADFLRACFRMNPRNARAWRRPPNKSGLVIVRKRPVVFREGDPALVALFGLMRAEDLPEWFRGQTWTEPDLIIRTRDGKIHPGIFGGETGHRFSAVSRPRFLFARSRWPIGSDT